MRKPEKPIRQGERAYASISDMVSSISADPKFAEDFKRHVSERQIITKLVALRAAKGLSQSDLAARLGCSQSRVSKLESSADADLRVRDLADYAAALGLYPHVVLTGQGTKIAFDICEAEPESEVGQADARRRRSRARRLVN